MRIKTMGYPATAAVEIYQEWKSQKRDTPCVAKWHPRKRNQSISTGTSYTCNLQANSWNAAKRVQCSWVDSGCAFPFSGEKLWWGRTISPWHTHIHRWIKEAKCGIREEDDTWKRVHSVGQSSVSPWYSSYPHTRPRHASTCCRSTWTSQLTIVSKGMKEYGERKERVIQYTEGGNLGLSS